MNNIDREAAIKVIKDQHTYYVEEHLIKHLQYDIGIARLSEKVCHAMVDQRPDEFIDKTLPGPTGLVVWPADNLVPEKFQQICVVSTSRNYKTGYNGTDELHSMVDSIATELWNELDQEHERVKQIHSLGEQKMSHQQYIGPEPKFYKEMDQATPQRIFYVPAVAMFDPNAKDKGQLEVTFKIRYNYTFGNTRMWRKEDFEIEVAREKIWLKEMGLG